MSVSGAARLLGVHANTIRAWTDQGRLSCIRINDRGDRRYRDRDLLAFLEDAGLQPLAAAPFQSRLRPAAAQRLTATDEPAAASSVASSAGPWPTDSGLRTSMTTASPATMTVARDRPHAPATPEAAATPGAPAISTLPGSLGGPDASWADLGAPIAPRLAEETQLLALIGGLAAVQQRSAMRTPPCVPALRLLRDLGPFSMLAIGRWDRGRLVSHACEGAQRARAWWKTVDGGLARICCAEQRPVAASISVPVDLARRTGVQGDPAVQVYAPIGGATDAWGVLIVEAAHGVAIDRTRAGAPGRHRRRAGAGRGAGPAVGGGRDGRDARRR